MRRPLALVLVLGGWLLYVISRRDRRRERVHLHYDDGSTVTLERAAPEAARLLDLARAAL
jgi:hypothetical protein